MKIKLLLLMLVLSGNLIHSMERNEKIERIAEKSKDLKKLSDKELITLAVNGNILAALRLKNLHLNDASGKFWGSLSNFLQEFEDYHNFVKSMQDTFTQIHETICTLYKTDKKNFDKTKADYFNQQLYVTLHLATLKKYCEDIRNTYAGILKVSNNSPHMTILNQNYFTKLFFFEAQLEELKGSFAEADKKWNYLITILPRMGRYYKDDSQIDCYKIYFSNYLSMRGDYDKAISLLLPIAEVNAHAAYNCARAYQAQNKLENALEYYHKVLSLKKDDTDNIFSQASYNCINNINLQLHKKFNNTKRT